MTSDTLSSGHLLPLHAKFSLLLKRSHRLRIDRLNSTSTTTLATTTYSTMPFPLSRRWRAALHAKRQRRRLAPHIISALHKLQAWQRHTDTADEAAGKADQILIPDPDDQQPQQDQSESRVRADVLARRQQLHAEVSKWHQSLIDSHTKHLDRLLEIDSDLAQTADQQGEQHTAEEPMNLTKCFRCCCPASSADHESTRDPDSLQQLRDTREKVEGLHRDLVEAEEEIHRLDALMARAASDYDPTDDRRKKLKVQNRLQERQRTLEEAENNLKQRQEEAFHLTSKRYDDHFTKTLAPFL